MITFTDRQRILESARAAGFDLAGVAAVPAPGSDEETRQRERFLHWAEQGFAGDMAWMLRPGEDGEPMRSSLHKAVPWARSIILCAANYNSAQPRSMDPAPEGSGWIARYAWSGADGVATDYHEVLLRQLRQVESAFQALRSQDEPVQTRAYVDTGPVVERWFAQLAGIGWIGKNTCVLNQGVGSWMLLGVILTSVTLAEEAVVLPAADRCGTCTRCIDACPTDALIAPQQMDASRCIAYLTIEKKGSIAEELRDGMGRQVFGCDICQDVCPWNRRAPVGTNPQIQAREELVNPLLEELAAMDNAAFKQSFRGSPLERTGRKRLQRNVAIAMGNSHDPAHVSTLQRWAAGEDAVLAEAAGWALTKIAAKAVEGVELATAESSDGSASIVAIGPRPAG
jgi:epoxyqueuosine reductase